VRGPGGRTLFKRNHISTCLSFIALETELTGVEALREVKQELVTKKDHMYEMLIDELHRHIYFKSTSHLMKRFKREGSGRRPTLADGTPKKVSLADILSPALQNPAPRSELIIKILLIKARQIKPNRPMILKLQLT